MRPFQRGRTRRSITTSDWRDHLLFHEYFNGDTGQGLGASHQTGWTALVAKLVEQAMEYSYEEHPPVGADFAIRVAR